MSSAAQRRLPVLVIDPDPNERQTLVSLLSPQFTVYEAAGLRQAAEDILVRRPAIVLLELEEPDGDALAFIRHLRAEQTTRDVCIACVSRRSGVRDKVMSFQAGADDYVVKPVIPATFPYRVMLLTRIRHLQTQM